MDSRMTRDDAEKVYGHNKDRGVMEEDLKKAKERVTAIETLMYRWDDFCMLCGKLADPKKAHPLSPARLVWKCKSCRGSVCANCALTDTNYGLRGMEWDQCRENGGDGPLKEPTPYTRNPGLRIPCMQCEHDGQMLVCVNDDLHRLYAREFSKFTTVDFTWCRQVPLNVAERWRDREAIRVANTAATKQEYPE